MKVYSVEKEVKTDTRTIREFFVLEGKEAVRLMLLLQKEMYTKKEKQNAICFESPERTTTWTFAQRTLPTAQEAVEKKVSSIIYL